MISILVVDDHPVVQEGLVAVLEDEPDFQVDALGLVEKLHPDVILLDLELPGMDGIEAIPHLIALAPGARVVVLTAYDADERVLGAVRAGAKGYLLKGAAADEIARAVRAVQAGGSHLAPSRGARLILTARGKEELKR